MQRTKNAPKQKLGQITLHTTNFLGLNMKKKKIRARRPWLKGWI